MDLPVLADKQELIYDCSLQTQDVGWITYRERWMIGTNGKRESGKSMLADGLVWFIGFYGISAFVGYLTPNPFLCK